MSNLLDYVDWRGDLPLSYQKFNNIDAIILAQFVLLDFEGIIDKDKITLREAGKKFFELGRDKLPLGLLTPLDVNGLLRRAMDSIRYGDAIIHDRLFVLDKENNTQITAFTVDLSKHRRCVVFSGTGDTVVSWRENFDLIHKLPVPAQKVSVEYLESMARGYKGNLYVTGHSKGGNLTLYAVSHCNNSTQARITKAISFDGPGLNQEDVKLIANSPIYSKIVSIMPEESIIGRLFEHKERINIVQSINSGLYQHDAFMWKLTKDDFIYTDKFTEDSDNINQTVREILTNMDMTTRIEFVDALFEMVDSTDSHTLLEMVSQRKKLLEVFLKSDSKSRRLVVDVFKDLIKERSIRRLLINNIKEMRTKK